MSDSDWLQWPAEAVVALVRRLETRVGDLEAEQALAQARIAELEAELARRSGPPKPPQNSSRPPSKGGKARRPRRDGAQRGPPKGHLGTSRRRLRPDHVLRCRPTQCGHGQAALSDVRQRRVGRSQVLELPPLRPVVVEAWRYRARCPQCGETTDGE